MKNIIQATQKNIRKIVRNAIPRISAFCIFLIILHSPFSILHSQTTFPVQVTTNLIPPYSLYLSDYAAGATEHVSVTLINRDANRPDLNIRLRLTVKGQGFTLQTLPQAVFAPITIDPNVPYRLSQQEIAPYFDPATLNAQGLSMQSYRSEGKLPEGMLQFCFEAIEYNTGRPVSQQGCGTAWVTVQKPPQLSLPFNNENVTLREPLNLLFQWTPRHSGLAGVEYELIIKQLFDNGMRPEAAFAYSPEIIREHIKNTSFLYGAMMPPLTPGYRYAWAVRAVASDGFAEQRVFENDGMSEIRVFSLEEYCPPTQSIVAAYDRGVVNVQWTPQMEHKEFSVAYREKDSNNEWLYVRCPAPPAKLAEIGRGKTYEYRVGAACIPGSPVYGATMHFTVPDKDTAYLANCGVAPVIDLSNRQPLESLVPGEQFMAYDFPVTVLTVSGGNGVFSGTGYTQMPAMFNFAKYKLRFNHITINSDRRMIAGHCESIADPNEGQIGNLDGIFEGGVLYGTVKDGITKTGFTVDFAIDSDTRFSIENGELRIENGGKDVAFALPQDVLLAIKENPDYIADITVMDKDGNIYKLNPDNGIAPADQAPGVADTPAGVIAGGGFTLIGKTGDALTADNFNPRKLDAEEAVVSFRKGTGYYAFDTWQDYYEKSYLIRDKYENLNLIYRVPWKLLPSGKSDVIEATIDIKDKTIDPAKVVFKTPKGVEFTHKYENGVYTINLAGGEQGDGLEIYATYSHAGKYLNFGKLSLASYTEQTYKVVVVPVYDTPIDIAAIQKTLKDIYGPAGIHWEVTEEKGYFYSGANKFFEKKSGLLNSYTPEMREMNADFANSKTIDPKANYMFILQYSGSETLERDVAGFMPRGGQFGYIFTKDFKSDSEILQTIAHELGHGKLLLKHPFDKDYGIEQGVTDNLMDYVKGATHLAKWQWDVMSDPGIAQGVFDRDQDGMFPRLTNADDDILRFISLYQCGIKTNQSFDYYIPGYDGLLAGSNMTVNGKDNVRIRLVIKKDMVNYVPRKNAGQLTTISNNRIVFDSFWIEVTGMEVSDFAEYLDNGENQSDINKISKLLKEKNFREAYKSLYHLSTCDIKQLSYVDKVLIFEDFANTVYLEDSKDHIAITLLQSIVENPIESNAFYEWLTGHPKEVIGLFRGIDDEQTNNQFSALLIELFLQHNTIPSLSKTLTAEQYFVHDKNLKTYTEIKYQSDRLHFAQVIPSPNRELPLISPMQPIGVWFTDSNSDHNGDKDVLVYAPAICFKNTIQSYADKNLSEFLYAGAQVAGIAVGYGYAIGGSVTILRIAGVVEMANRSVSLSLQSSTIRGNIENSEEGRQFLEWWPTISKTADIATIITFTAIPLIVERNFISYQNQAVNKQIKKATGQAEDIADDVKLSDYAGSGLPVKVNNLTLAARFEKEGLDNLRYWVGNVTDANLLNKLDKLDKNVLSKLESVPKRNPEFYSKVESNPNILDFFEEGSKNISNKAPNLKAVELDMYALDRAREGEQIIFETGTTNYKVNYTRKSFHQITNSEKLEINIQSGKIRDANGNIMFTDNKNSEGLMFVIDETDNIFIGGRGGEISFPHPTLVGGQNPNVKCAGMIRFKDGRILEINNNSGHFKPSAEMLKNAEQVFKQKLPSNSFDNQFNIKQY